MADVLGCIRKKVGGDHCTRSCSRDGCQVHMTGIPSPRVIADADRAFPSHGVPGKRCDFVLFFRIPGNVLVIAPLELKHGAGTADAAAQLQAGAVFAERMIPNTSNPIFRPVLFHGKGLYSKQRKALNRAKVRFRGTDFTIKIARCGRPRNLAAALSPCVC